MRGKMNSEGTDQTKLDMLREQENTLTGMIELAREAQVEGEIGD